MIKNKLRYSGRYEIRKNGKLIAVIENHVTDAFLNALANQLTGNGVDLKIKYLAVGDGSTVYDNKLGNEICRVPATSVPTLTNTGEITTEFIILPSEAIGTITEIGIFCGDDATTEADSGIMISRIPWEYEKTGSDEFIITRVDTIGRSEE